MLHAYRCAALLAALMAAPLPANAQRAHTTAQWKEDLAFLAAELPKRHRNAYHKVSKATFDSAVSAIDMRLPQLNDHQSAIALASLVALVGDGHSRMTLPLNPGTGFDRAHTGTLPPNDSSLFMNHLPIKIASFPEGLFVRAATAEYKDLIGARILRIGRMRADSAMEAIRPVVHYDNEMGFEFLAPTMLTIPEVLQAFQVEGTTAFVTIVLETREGVRRTVKMPAVPLFGAPEFIESRSLLANVPLWERDLSSWYWMKYLPQERVLYVQYNRVNSAEEENIVDFAARMRKTFAESGAQKLVIDLRHNPGGNGNTMRPMLMALLRDSAINQFGRFFVLIGRETFSAAQFLVNDLEHASNVLFVGEPTGGSPSSYGDSRKFRLPNSGLTVRASTIYWRDANPDEKRPATPPDFAVPLTAADYFSGVDPVLNAVVAYDVETGPLTLIRRVQKEGGWPQAMRLCWRFGGDSTLPRAVGAEAMVFCGNLLNESGHPKVAIEWYEASATYLPDEPRVYAEMAAVLRGMGKTAEADAAAAKAARLSGSR